jgi:hypothetical protein
MGHSTITMTMRYMHLAPEAGRELIGVLSRERQVAKTPTNRATPGGFELADRYAQKFRHGGALRDLVSDVGLFGCSALVA